MPARPAIAARWRMPLVEPPSASRTRSALSTAAAVTTSDGRGPRSTIATACMPLASAARRRSAWTAGIAAVPGSVMPSVSARQAIVLAVPITMQVPAVVASRLSIAEISSALDRAGAVLRPEPPAVGAGAEPLVAVPAGHHRPGHDQDRGLVGRERAHQQRRHGLVAAADQHDRVHRLSADHLLDVHAHQVAEHQAGRVQERLAERDHRELERQAAGREHAAFGGLDQLGHVAVAVVEAARGVRDPDHRARQQRLAIAHRAGERAPQIEREVGIAVVGQAPGEAGFLGRGHVSSCSRTRRPGARPSCLTRGRALRQRRDCGRHPAGDEQQLDTQLCSNSQTTRRNRA